MNVIECLNILLKNRLTAINQHFLHARVLKYQGNLELADYQYKISIEAMRHADMLVEHILMLGGIPRLQELNTLRIGENIHEMLQGDLQLAQEAESQASNLVSAYGGDDTETVALLNKILISQTRLIEYIHSYLNPANANCVSEHA